jgi:hypothetical protein
MALLDWLKIAGIVVPIVGTGYIAYYRIGVAEEALADTRAVVNVNGNRITRLEEQGNAIRQSLEDIKSSLRGVNEKLDRQ